MILPFFHFSPADELEQGYGAGMIIVNENEGIFSVSKFVSGCKDFPQADDVGMFDTLPSAGQRRPFGVLQLEIVDASEAVVVRVFLPCYAVGRCHTRAGIVLSVSASGNHVAILAVIYHRF